MSKDLQPHKAILQITIDIMDVLKTGECSGTPLNSKELSDNGIKQKLVRVVNVFDKNDCITKLKRILDSMETK